MATGVGAEQIRLANWSGSIPIVLTLAPTSLSSPTTPPSIHMMLSRMTYLHVGLQNSVMRLYKYAPTAITIKGGVRTEPDPGASSETEEDDAKDNSASTETESNDFPVCWFEDEETQIALRWHIFVGVLYDQKRRSKDVDIPWKIRLHFTAYPSSQILPLDAADGVSTTLERTFKNSLKQALFLQHGSSKVSMSISKQSHEQVWDSILTSNYELYQQVNSDLQANFDNSNNSTQNIPVRLMVDSKAPIQKTCKAYVENQDEAQVPYTLGSLLVDWIPNLYVAKPDGSVKAESTATVYSVQGIRPPLSMCIKDLWHCLCHPDHFLYVVVATR